MGVAGAEANAGPDTRTVARGRFDGARAGSAFLATTRGASATEWRGSPLWDGQGRAVALVTPRTLAQGDGQRVRAAIDASWAIVGDANGGALGELRRSLGADRNPAAVTLALTVTEGMRARAAGVTAVPDGLRRIGARLDLGDDLNLEGAALFDSHGHAVAAASIWSETVRAYTRQPMVMLLGLGPIFQGMTLAAEGSRVHVRLHIGAEKREGLAEKVQAVLEALAKARH